MFEGIRRDIQAVKERDPAARNTAEVLLLYSGIHAIMLHRPAHWLYQHEMFFSARLISQFSRFLTGVEIHPGAKLGHGILIDHGSGVVIGETAEVGDNCTIYQGETLGGTGKEKGKRHPTIGSNVMIGSGAKILGPVKVADNCKIASNAVLLRDLEEDSTAVGVPARVVRVAGEKIDPSKLDHTHTPDPVAIELQKALARIEQLEARLSELEQKRNENDA